MKTLSLLLLAALALPPAAAQGHLSRDFSVKALRALRAVGEYTGTSQELDTPSFVATLVNAAQDSALTPPERKALAALKQFLRDKATNNDARAYLLLIKKQTWRDYSPYATDADFEEDKPAIVAKINKRPFVVMMTGMENECEAGLEESLRKQVYALPRVCRLVVRQDAITAEYAKVQAE